MMKSIQHLALCLSLIAFICSCGSDDGVEKKFAGDELTGKPWSVTEIEVELGTLTPQPCISDNNYTYFESGRYEVNEGVTKCDPNDPPGLTGSWSLNDDESEITIQLEDSVRVWTILEVTNSIHRLSSDFDGDEIIYTFESL